MSHICNSLKTISRILLHWFQFQSKRVLSHIIVTMAHTLYVKARFWTKLGRACFVIKTTVADASKGNFKPCQLIHH